jgi:ribosomal protein L5
MILKIKKTTYLQLIKDLDCSSPKKISAIKAVRIECNCGLKEAKDAVEHLMYEKGFSSIPANTTEHKIVSSPIIKKIIVDYGTGDIEVDIESMQLRALMDMQVIGIDACADILDLVAVLNAYENGEKFGVINEDS